MVSFERKISKLAHNTKFNNCNAPLSNCTVNDFWQWAYSDLLQNTTRGVLAEYIVAVLLGVDKTPRDPWMPFDLKLDDGRTIEVKTMSRLQAWVQKQLSDPKIVLCEKRRWNLETGIMEQKPTLNADIYIICYFTSEDHSIANPLNLHQWNFFILYKKEVEAVLKKSKSISLKMLNKMNKKSLKVHELRNEVLKFDS